MENSSDDDECPRLSSENSPRLCDLPNVAIGFDSDGEEFTVYSGSGSVHHYHRTVDKPAMPIELKPPFRTENMSEDEYLCNLRNYEQDLEGNYCYIRLQQMEMEEQKAKNEKRIKYLEEEIEQCEKECDDWKRKYQQLSTEYAAVVKLCNDRAKYYQTGKNISVQMILSSQHLWREKELQLEVLAHKMYNRDHSLSIQVDAEQKCFLCQDRFMSGQDVVRKTTCCGAIIHSQCYLFEYTAKCSSYITTDSLESANEAARAVCQNICGHCRQSSLKIYDEPRVATTLKPSNEMTLKKIKI